MAIVKCEITEAQAQELENLDGSVILLFVQTGCDGLLRVSNYETDECLLECAVVGPVVNVGTLMYE